jgi:uncharacterized membrane protein
MSPTETIVLLWLAFAGTHLGLASVRVRPRLVGRLGENGYLGLFSLVALGLFVPLVWVYFTHRHAGAWLWAPLRGPVLDWTLYGLMGVAFVMIVSSFTATNPALMGSKDARGGVRGVFLLARHPLFVGLGLWAALHLVWNAAASDVAFFGGFVGFVLVGAWHQDWRKLATGVPGYREFVQAAPFVPFTGRDTLRGLRGLSPLALVLGVAAALGLRWLHPVLFRP